MKKTNKTSTNNTTELVFILDASGSMSGFESDTIGGFNSMLEKQKVCEGKAYVTTYIFDSSHKMLHDRIDIQEVKPLTREDYYVGGTTALYDTVGEAITHIEGIHKYARPSDVPAKTIFVITTDGMENASREYTNSAIRRLIKEKTDKQKWEFIFMAANIDAKENAERMGIRRERAMNVHQSTAGYERQFDAMDKIMCCMRRSDDLHDIDIEKFINGLSNDKK
ncbi:MAG: VWA domain-containing protein [Clostridia bacterium]|nr:VWA domain-containing protein [Clostridia bacterium]